MTPQEAMERAKAALAPDPEFDARVAACRKRALEGSISLMFQRAEDAAVFGGSPEDGREVAD